MANETPGAEELSAAPRRSSRARKVNSRFINDEVDQEYANLVARIAAPDSHSILQSPQLAFHCPKPPPPPRVLTPPPPPPQQNKTPVAPLLKNQELSTEVDTNHVGKKPLQSPIIKKSTPNSIAVSKKQGQTPTGSKKVNPKKVLNVKKEVNAKPPTPKVANHYSSDDSDDDLPLSAIAGIARSSSFLSNSSDDKSLVGREEMSNGTPNFTVKTIHQPELSSLPIDIVLINDPVEEEEEVKPKKIKKKFMGMNKEKKATGIKKEKNSSAVKKERKVNAGVNRLSINTKVIKVSNAEKKIRDISNNNESKVKNSKLIKKLNAPGKFIKILNLKMNNDALNKLSDNNPLKKYANKGSSSQSDSDTKLMLSPTSQVKFENNLSQDEESVLNSEPNDLEHSLDSKEEMPEVKLKNCASEESLTELSKAGDNSIKMEPENESNSLIEENKTACKRKAADSSSTSKKMKVETIISYKKCKTPPVDYSQNHIKSEEGNPRLSKIPKMEMDDMKPDISLIKDTNEQIEIEYKHKESKILKHHKSSSSKSESRSKNGSSSGKSVDSNKSSKFSLKEKSKSLSTSYKVENDLDDEAVDQKPDIKPDLIMNKIIEGVDGDVKPNIDEPEAADVSILNSTLENSVHETSLANSSIKAEPSDNLDIVRNSPLSVSKKEHSSSHRSDKDRHRHHSSSKKSSRDKDKDSRDKDKDSRDKDKDSRDKDKDSRDKDKDSRDKDKDSRDKDKDSRDKDKDSRDKDKDSRDKDKDSRDKDKEKDSRDKDRHHRRHDSSSRSSSDKKSDSSRHSSSKSHSSDRHRSSHDSHKSSRRDKDGDKKSDRDRRREHDHRKDHKRSTSESVKAERKDEKKTNGESSGQTSKKLDPTKTEVPSVEVVIKPESMSSKEETKSLITVPTSETVLSVQKVDKIEVETETKVPVIANSTAVHNITTAKSSSTNSIKDENVTDELVPVKDDPTMKTTITKEEKSDEKVDLTSVSTVSETINKAEENVAQKEKMELNDTKDQVEDVPMEVESVDNVFIPLNEKIENKEENNTNSPTIPEVNFKPSPVKSPMEDCKTETDLPPANETEVKVDIFQSPVNKLDDTISEDKNSVLPKKIEQPVNLLEISKQFNDGNPSELIANQSALTEDSKSNVLDLPSHNGELDNDSKPKPDLKDIKLPDFDTSAVASILNMCRANMQSNKKVPNGLDLSASLEKTKCESDVPKDEVKEVVKEETPEEKLMNQVKFELEKKEREARNAEVVKQRLASFEHLTENLYLIDKKKNKTTKETRRMVCDCSLTKEELSAGEKGCGDDCLNRMLMIECGWRCPLEEACLNRQFQHCTYAPIEVFNAEEKGCGVRAKEDISPGTFIMEYIGEVFDQREFRRRRKDYGKDGTAHFYFMALRANQFIDATKKGNVSRFVNHSCDPNAETQKWTVNGELRIGFFSTKTISAGEEINFDYRMERYGREPQKCYCGSVLCRGWLGEPPTEKTKEEKEEERKKKKRDERKQYDDEIQEDLSILQKAGLRNKHDTLLLSRVMVRSESDNTRMLLLQLLGAADMNNPHCLRLFLDYHGLSILWSWMADLGPNATPLKERILDILDLLPISNKSQVSDSKVMDIVEKWSREEYVESAKKLDEESDEEEASPPDGATTPEENREEMKESHNQMVSHASKLLEGWRLLKEEFRIPKKQRVRIMREHEREVEADYRRYINSEKGQRAIMERFKDKRQNSYFSNLGNRMTMINKDRFGWSAPATPKFDPNDPEYIGLNKEERRQKFAQKAAFEDEQRRTQENMWTVHCERCSQSGLDPYYTPIVDPSGQYYWDSEANMWIPLPHNAYTDHMLQGYTPPQTLQNTDPFLVPVAPDTGHILRPIAVTINLPPHWHIARDSFNRVYFYHSRSREVRWEVPTPDTKPNLQLEIESDSDESSESELESEEEFSDDEDTVGGDSEVSAAVLSEEKEQETLEGKIIRRQRGKRRHSEALVQQRVISPIRELDRELARKERREAKERAKVEAKRDRVWGVGIPVEEGEGVEEEGAGEEYVPTPIGKRNNKDKTKDGRMSKERAATAMSDTSEKARKIKDLFRSRMATFIVSVLNPFRRSDCKKGRIANTEDFKYLARKLTHFVMVKELKQLPSIDDLQCNENVKHKTKEFVKKYMGKYGSSFKRDPNDTKEY